MTHRRLRMESLEDRRLLAVTAAFNSGSGLLTLTGNSASDTLVVDGNGPTGSVTASGTDLGPTAFSGVRSIRVNLGSGDDNLYVSRIQIGGDLNVNMGSGPDRFYLKTAGILGIDNTTFIGGNVVAAMGNNAGDRVDFETGGEFGITIGGDVRLTQVADVALIGSSNGNNCNYEPGDITIGGSLSIGLSSFDDVNADNYKIYLDDVNVGNTTTLTGSSGNDRMQLIDGNFARRVAINMGAGNDFLNLLHGSGNGNRFADKLAVNGGAGFDSFNRDIDNIFAQPPTTLLVESIYVV